MKFFKQKVDEIEYIKTHTCLDLTDKFYRVDVNKYSISNGKICTYYIKTNYVNEVKNIISTNWGLLLNKDDFSIPEDTSVDIYRSIRKDINYCSYKRFFWQDKKSRNILLDIYIIDKKDDYYIVFDCIPEKER